ncbi:MAG: DUF5081 family protein [Lachnospiraceae bacterium]|nr:DUF5081 family protein [Lachnospiraceae bacterium]
MTIQEIFILNSILDGKEICFLPELSEIKMTEPLDHAIKDSLIRKGFLENRDQLTEQGFLITRRLMNYKAASKYIKIMSLSIGILNSEEAVMINQLSKKEYDITVIDIRDITHQFLETFDFLNDAPNSKTMEEIKIRADKLEKTYNFKNNYFELQTKIYQTGTEEAYFRADNQLYMYDYKRRLLYPKSHADIINLLKERFMENQA